MNCVETSQVTQAETTLSGRWNRSERGSPRAGRWWLLALLLMLLPACHSATDLASERHAKAVKALINLGAEVHDVQDEVSHDRGTYVFLFAEHFTHDGKRLLTKLRRMSGALMPCSRP